MGEDLKTVSLLNMGKTEYILVFWTLGGTGIFGMVCVKVWY